MKAKIKKYTTQYLVNRNKYGSHIWAYNIRQAESIALLRQIGEKVLGESGIATDGYGRLIPEEILSPNFSDLTDFDFVKQLPQIIHTACFLCFIYSNMYPHKSKSILGDEEILHQLIHLQVSEETNVRMVKRARGKFKQLQNNIPGYLKVLIKQ